MSIFAPLEGSTNPVLGNKLVDGLVAVSKESGYLESLECLKIDDSDDMARLRAQTYVSSLACCQRDPKNTPFTPSTKEKGKGDGKETEKELLFDLELTRIEVVPQDLLTHNRSSMPHKGTAKVRDHSASLEGLGVGFNLYKNPFDRGNLHALWTYVPTEKSLVEWRLPMLNIEDQVRHHLAAHLPPIDKLPPVVPLAQEFWTEQVPAAMNLGFRIYLFNCECKLLQRKFNKLRQMASPTAGVGLLVSMSTTPLNPDSVAEESSSSSSNTATTTVLDYVVENGDFAEVTGAAENDMNGFISVLDGIFRATKPAGKLLQDALGDARFLEEQEDALVVVPDFARLCRMFLKGTAKQLSTCQAVLMEHDKELRGCVNALREVYEGHKCVSMSPDRRPDNRCLDCVCKRIKVWYDDAAPRYTLWATHFRPRNAYARAKSWSFTDDGAAILQDMLKRKAEALKAEEASKKEKAKSQTEPDDDDE